MTDQCSILSYDELKKSGNLGKAQARYLYAFIQTDMPMSHKAATGVVYRLFGVSYPQRNGRIAELEEMGILEKYDVIECEETKKRVNRWKWTGRKHPLPFKEEWAECQHCNGKGGSVKRVYYEGNPSPKEDFFD